jgi:hypothetical protein
MQKGRKAFFDLPHIVRLARFLLGRRHHHAIQSARHHEAEDAQIVLNIDRHAVAGDSP